MNSKVTVTANHMRYLRKGLRSEFGFAAQSIATFMLDHEDEPLADEYKHALETFDAARALLSDLTSTSDQQQSNIELDLGFNALLVLKALECQYNAELDRLEEAAFYGPTRDADHKEVQTLRDLVMVVREACATTGGTCPRASA
jgi:hypothetical protein